MAFLPWRSFFLPQSEAGSTQPSAQSLEFQPGHIAGSGRRLHSRGIGRAGQDVFERPLGVGDLGIRLGLALRLLRRLSPLLSRNPAKVVTGHRTSE